MKIDDQRNENLFVAGTSGKAIGPTNKSPLHLATPARTLHLRIRLITSDDLHGRSEVAALHLNLQLITSELRSNLPQQFLGHPGFDGRISWLDGADSTLMA